MRAHTITHDVNWRIVEDDDGLSYFARASENIAAAVALLRGLLEPVTPEECWA
jgi:hypothetical protein